MNYGLIYNCDTANGPGLRVSLFVSGCTHHCPGCFNAQTWDFNFGQPYTEQIQTDILDMLDNSYIQGLTILGGEPMEPQNQPAVYGLVKAVRERLPEKDVWIYSGYTFEELQNPEARCYTANTHDILSLIDVLVDGRFVMAEKDVTLTFRGSRNQRILDAKASLKASKPCWVEHYR